MELTNVLLVAGGLMGGLAASGGGDDEPEVREEEFEGTTEEPIEQELWCIPTDAEIPTLN